MTKTDEMLAYFKEHLNEWCCSTCAAPHSGQPAAQFRECKKKGYRFEEPVQGRWAKNQYCEQCGQITPHYKLLSAEPIFQQKDRITIKPKTRERILQLLENKDAFTDGGITSVAEIDHKEPWTRLDKDVDANTLSDEEIKEHYQLLTREHNLLKDRACAVCKKDNIRPPLFGIDFWYEGGQEYNGTCVGCGWYDGREWRKQLNKILKENTD